MWSRQVGRGSPDAGHRRAQVGVARVGSRGTVPSAIVVGDQAEQHCSAGQGDEGDDRYGCHGSNSAPPQILPRVAGMTCTIDLLAYRVHGGSWLKEEVLVQDGVEQIGTGAL